ncbi:hypothetical protein AURDEDRAFT_186165 [Auricularia subglabra TFB-10046 SS5]|nr:hypothetical protein AURDEDRAFT_186165 [Auricularia subglabra TFB-10046 SS5]
MASDLPSDTWQTAEELASDPRGSHKAWTKINFEAIEFAAGALHSPPSPCTANRAKYSTGAFAIAVELVFPDGEVWIAKLATNHFDQWAVSQEILLRRLRCEAATLKIIRERTSVPVPTVFGFAADYTNPIGLPYILMSAVIGYRPEKSGLRVRQQIVPFPHERFETFCASFASVHLELRKISFDRIGSIYIDENDPSGYSIGPDAETGIPPCETASEFYAAYGRLILRDALRDEPAKDHEDRLFGVWLCQLLLAAASAGLDNSGPFMLAHQDLHVDNTLIKTDGVIAGVIDWDNAACLPVEMFAGQMLQMTKDLENNSAERLKWFSTYNHILRTQEDSGRHGASPLPSGCALAGIHASTIVQVLRVIANHVGMGNPEFYGKPWFWGLICHHLLATEDWTMIRRSAIFQGWLADMKAAL